MPANSPQPAYKGQAQIAPDNALSPGTYAALSEAATVKTSVKPTQVDYSPLGGGSGRRRAPTVIDTQVDLDFPYDSGDVGASNIYTAALAQSRLWARIFETATAWLQLPSFCSQLVWDSSDPAGLTKVKATLMLDGGTSGPVTGTGSLLTPAALTAPAAGYKAILSIPGTSTPMVAEACSLVSGKTYRITNTAKRLLDPTVAVSVLDNGAPVAVGSIVSVDMLFGRVTFTNAYVPAGPITITANYLPMNQVAWIKKLTSTMKFDLSVVTTLASAGYVMRVPTVTDYSGSFSVEDLLSSDPQDTGGANIGASSWFALTTSRSPILVEHDPDGTQTNVLRAWSNIEGEDESLAFGDVVTQDLSLVLNNRTNGIYQAGFGIGAP